MAFDLQPTLEGDRLRLRPLRTDDWDALYAVASDRLIWEQHPAPDRYQEPVFREFFREAMESGGAFVVIDKENGGIIGSSRFLGYDEGRSEIEIGFTFLARKYWGGSYNQEMKDLMLGHAFRFVRHVVFVVGPTNWRSQKAMEKIGGVRIAPRLNPMGRMNVVFQLDAPRLRAPDPARTLKTLGIIGGIGPGSTVDYYQTIIELFRARKGDGSYPPILINSIDLQRVLATVGAGELKGLTNWLLTELKKLERAGADFAIMASNTPHIVFDNLERQSPLPLISIVRKACSAAKACGLKRLALFGTRFTMQGTAYRDVFSRQEITVVVPEATDLDYIHDKYMSELLAGIFLPETRAGLLAVIDRMADQSRIDGVILGGTELPLLLRDPSHNGIPLLNTTRIHCEAAVEWMLSYEI